MPGPAPTDHANLVAEMAVERGYVSRAQIEEAMQVRTSLDNMGVPEALGRILLKKGFITEAQLRELESRTQPRQPASIGGFEIVARLGRGGMGTVYRARQVSMDRIVALKILSPALAKDKVFVERFLREARIVAKLNHPNIVQGIDVGADDKYYYFAMEFVEGDTLEAVIARDGPIGERKALEIALHVSHALHHAQRYGMVHRDIKPDNIMITPAGVAKLCDLGLAKSFSQDPSLTQSGMTVGTPHYVSPEQARGDADVDIRADIYSLGATLYHAVLGRTPFSGSSAAVVMTKHLNDEPEDPRSLRPELSAGIAALIMKMMAKDRAVRPPSPEALVNDIHLVMAGRLPAGVRVVASVGAAQARVAKRTAAHSSKGAQESRNLALWAAVAGFLCVLVGLGLWMGTRSLGSSSLGGLPAPDNSGAKVGADADQEAGRLRLGKFAERYAAIVDYANRCPDDHDRTLADLEQLAKDGVGTIYEHKARDEARRIATEQERKSDDEVARIKSEADFFERQEKFGEAVRLYDRAPIQIMLRERQRIDALAQSRYAALLSEARRVFRAGRYDTKNSGAFAEAAACLNRAATFGLPKISEKVSADIAAMQAEHETMLADRDRRLAAERVAAQQALTKKFLVARSEVFGAASKVPKTAAEPFGMRDAAKLAGQSLLVPEFQLFRDEASRIESDLRSLDAFLVRLPEAIRPRSGRQIILLSQERGREEGVVERVSSSAIDFRLKGMPAGSAVTIGFARLLPTSLFELAGLSKTQPADCYLVGTLAFYTGRWDEALEILTVVAKDDARRADAEYYMELARSARRLLREQNAEAVLKDCRARYAQYRMENVRQGDPRWATLKHDLELLLTEFSDTDVVRCNRDNMP